MHNLIGAILSTVCSEPSSWFANCRQTHQQQHMNVAVWTLAGSGRSFTAYVFNRAQLAELDRPPQSPITPAAVGSRRESLESSDTQVPPELLADARVQIHGAREEANEREEGEGSDQRIYSAAFCRPQQLRDVQHITVADECS